MNVLSTTYVYKVDFLFLFMVKLTGVPKETGSILQLREAVDACRVPQSGPVVVHCRYVRTYVCTHNNYMLFVSYVVLVTASNLVYLHNFSILYQPLVY